MLDDRTAGVIRTALEAAQAGRIEEARAIGEKGLSAGCDAGPLHAMIGSFYVQTRDFAASLAHLERAREARPTDPIIVRNLATALIECGRFADALAELNGNALSNDKTANLMRLRGYAAQESGDHLAAVEAYEWVLERHPADWETWNNLGSARQRLGQLDAAVAAFRRATEINPGELPVQLNLVLALYAAGGVSEVEARLRQLTADFPHDALPWRFLYRLLKEQGWDAEAKDVLEGALERAPGDIPMMTMLGREHLFGFEMQAAARTFRDILKLHPTCGDAFIGMADVLERESPAKLSSLVAEAQAAGVDPVAARIMRALLAFREKRYREGADELEGLPDDAYPVRRWHLSGLLLDRLGDAESAFQAFTKLNHAQADDPTQPLPRAAALREQLRDRLTQITPEWRDSWRAPPVSPSRRSPAFLVGFPRSGTTLLDTILMGHPDVEVLEERPVLNKVSLDIGGFEGIAELDEGGIRRAQERYFELARELTPMRDGTLLIDKSPLHMQHLGLIHRLFPDAQVILALRHPADVLLSCFMANFRLNSAMASFLQLDTGAEFYDLTFSLWERSLALFPVDTHRIVYERLIVEPEEQLKPLVQALGLTWRAEMLDHQRTAEARGIITTASYAQVTQPLYREAAGRWRRYRRHLEPVLPVLAPWIDKLGYEL